MVSLNLTQKNDLDPSRINYRLRLTIRGDGQLFWMSHKLLATLYYDIYFKSVEDVKK